MGVVSNPFRGQLTEENCSKGKQNSIYWIVSSSWAAVIVHAVVRNIAKRSWVSHIGISTAENVVADLSLPTPAAGLLSSRVHRKMTIPLSSVDWDPSSSAVFVGRVTVTVFPTIFATGGWFISGQKRKTERSEGKWIQKVTVGDDTPGEGYWEHSFKHGVHH